jgi:hypothetical protein
MFPFPSIIKRFLDNKFCNYSLLTVYAMDPSFQSYHVSIDTTYKYTIFYIYKYTLNNTTGQYIIIGVTKLKPDKKPGKSNI